MKRVCIFLLFVAAAFAQEQATVEGEIAAAAGVDRSWLTIRLRGDRASDPPITARVEHDGRFTLRHIPNGAYLLEVLDADGNPITMESLMVSYSTGPVIVRLPERPVAAPPGGAISAARLMHHPDKSALRAAREAQKLSAKGDHQRAAAALERAVALDPQYADAQNNLGVQYMKLGRLADAADRFERAAALDPGGAVEQLNLAVALAKLGRLAEAETWARGAVRLDGANPMARSVLAAIVAARHRTAALR